MTCPETATTKRGDRSAAGQAVVIGAGSGLGRSLALRFADEGLHVALLARDGDRLQAIAGQVQARGGTARAVPVDAGHPQQLAEVVADLRGQEPIVLLAYNAAAVAGRLSTSNLAELQHAAAVNLHSPVLAVQAALADLQAHKGSVLLTGGGFALYPSAEFGVLSVGRAGLRATALTLAADLAPSGVKVRTVTIAGTISPGSPLDPDLLAELFWQVHLQPDSPVETVCDDAARALAGLRPGPVG